MHLPLVCRALWPLRLTMREVCKGGGHSARARLVLSLQGDIGRMQAQANETSNRKSGYREVNAVNLTVYAKAMLLEGAVRGNLNLPRARCTVSMQMASCSCGTVDPALNVNLQRSRRGHA